MAQNEKTPRESAERFVRDWKPICWVCGCPEWEFLGIHLLELHPDGEDGTPPTSRPSARFACKRCAKVLEADCHRAAILTRPVQ